MKTIDTKKKIQVVKFGVGVITGVIIYLLIKLTF